VGKTTTRMSQLPEMGRKTQTREPIDRGDDPPPLCYLLVIEDLSSRRISLPHDGILHIGRDPEADIHIASPDVSRRHARLILSGGRAQIADAGSHNGTLVNGERVDGSQSLSSGDVVTIADALLVLRVAAPEPTHRAIDIDRMRERIQDEIVRAAAYGRSFALAVIHVEGQSSPRGLEAAALGVLRETDALAIQGANLVALLPELEVEAARMLAGALILAVTPQPPAARAGVACYPHDGCDLDTLLSGARGAAVAAAPGGVKLASQLAVEHAVGASTIVVADPAMTKLYELIRRLAASTLSVLIMGETGTGKENAAEALHCWSPRADKPFAALNCAALPETLVESELFGHERGAFSEAKVAKPGLLERTSGGTVFLDEVGDLAPPVQAKLLRALEQKRITRLGDTREREIDVRIVAATNVDLEAAVHAGRFRRDLLFRLSAAVVTLPPLRDRRREIPLLARFFVERERERMKRPALEIAEAALATLGAYGFPGNIRELKNAMDYAVATAEGPAIQLWNLPERIQRQAGGNVAEPPRAGQRAFRAVADEIRELERRRIVEALAASGGVKTRAAAAIGMPIRTFSFKLRQYGIDADEVK
jgi:two-component system response regulator AtoC